MVSSINNYLSSYILVILLIAVGLWYTIRTHFVQVRCFGEGMRRVFGSLTLRGKRHKSGMSSFQRWPRPSPRRWARATSSAPPARS